jgi:phosphoribosylformylglycinamidine synthase
VDAQSALARYRTLHRCMQQRMITACHDLSDGGLGVAVAEMCLAGRQGADIRLDDTPALETMSPAELLYSESASRLLVSVRGDRIEDFEDAFRGQICTRIGRTTNDGVLRIEYADRELLREHVEELAGAFKATLNW